MSDRGIKATCGACGTTQTLYTEGYKYDDAVELASVMDGSSPLFINIKPDRSDCLPGNLGRCAHCASEGRIGVFTCKPFGFPEQTEPVIQVHKPEPVARAVYQSDDLDGSGGLVSAEPITRTTENSVATSGVTPGYEDAPAPGPVRVDGQHTSYWVLKPEERAKGFVRPVRYSYKHVGILGPKGPLRDLTPEETERYSKYGYVKYEEYLPPTPTSGDDDHPAGSIPGRFWKQAELDRVRNGCGGITTMSRAIAETYARSPQYYGSTFCVHCGKHFPVGSIGEFVWCGPEQNGQADERVGT